MKCTDTESKNIKARNDRILNLEQQLAKSKNENALTLNQDHKRKVSKVKARPKCTNTLRNIFQENQGTKCMNRTLVRNEVKARNTQTLSQAET